MAARHLLAPIVLLSFICALQAQAAAFAETRRRLCEDDDQGDRNAPCRWLQQSADSRIRQRGAFCKWRLSGFLRHVAAIEQSKKGDPVRMCLVSIPHPCPKGDDRGRVYKTTNLRTHKSWSLPDSEHMCGGA